MPEAPSLIDRIWKSNSFRIVLLLVIVLMILAWVSEAIDFDFPLIPDRQYSEQLGLPYDIRHGACSPERLVGEGQAMDDRREDCWRRAADYDAAFKQLSQSFRQTNAAEESLRLAWFQTRFGFFQVLLSTLAVIFTGWAAFAAGSAARAAASANSKSAEANEIARQAIAEAHRPWVTVEVTPLGKVMITENGASVLVHLKAVNVGQTPALEVDFAVEAVASVRGGLVEAQQALSERVRQREANLLARNLFPGEEHNTSYGVSTFEAGLAPILAQVPDEQGRRRLPLAVIGCVQYRAVGNAFRHQTGFIFEFAALQFEDLPAELPVVVFGRGVEGDAVID